jgi:hemoglobin/transferrin/lactoferrin receptor protein
MKHISKGVLWICLCLALPMHAQIVRVLDQDSRDPLPQVVIFMEDPLITTTTDEKGRADLSKFPKKGELHFRLMGYQALLISLEDGPINKTILMESGYTSLAQVVVSANRWAQARAEVPFKVKSISAKEVQFQNPQTAADLLGQSGEVFIQKSQQGGGSPMIRGFATNRLLISVDGVRMNTAIFRSGNLQNIISIDPFAVENTEVLFGPGSVMYGSDAIGGVMSFYTLNPRFALNDSLQTKVNVATRYASANEEMAGHFDVQLGWKKWAVVLSASHTRFGDLRMGRNGPNDYLRPWYVQRQDSVDRVVQNEDPLVQNSSGYTQDNFMAKLAHRNGKGLELSYAFHFSGTSDYARYDRLIRTRNGLPRSAEWNYGPQLWNMHQLQLKLTNPKRIYDALQLSLAMQNFEESRIDRDLNDTERRTRLEQVDAYSLNLDLNKSLGNGHSLFYGAEVIWNEVFSTGTDQDISTGQQQAGPSRYPRSNWYSWAFFSTWRKNWEEELTLQAGFRYNGFGINADFSNNVDYYPLPFETSSFNNGALTGSVGMEWQASENWNISTHFSTAFRSPNVDDMGKVFDSEPGSVVVPNPNVQPEYAYTGEIDIARKFGDWMDVDVVAYYTLLQDALVRRSFSINGQDSILYDGELSQVQAVQNAAQARVWGIEARMEARFGKGFDFQSSLSYQKGEEELDDGSVSPSRHAAPLFGRTAFGFRRGPLRLEVYSLYSAERSFDDMPLEEISKDYLYASDAEGRPYSPAWATINFKMQYQFSRQLSAQVGVENLSDERYRPYSSGLAAAGRNFIFGLRLGI